MSTPDTSGTVAPAVPDAPAVNTGGRPSTPFGVWLASAPIGGVYWTDRPMQTMSRQVANSGRKVAMRRFYAVSDDLQAVALVRVEVLS